MTYEQALKILGERGYQDAIVVPFDRLRDWIERLEHYDPQGPEVAAYKMILDKRKAGKEPPTVQELYSLHGKGAFPLVPRNSGPPISYGPIQGLKPRDQVAAKVQSPEELEALERQKMIQFFKSSSHDPTHPWSPGKDK